ncbi:MAG: PIN domain-containing protein [Chloroflexi bacterium]|nr:PIN domain-containing protein [Chloroflexota bacterium]
MTTYLIDTNIISAVVRKEESAEKRFRQAIANDDVLLLSMVVLYEVKRGLLKRDAKKQTAAFEHLASQFAWCDTIRSDWEQAAEF